MEGGEPAADVVELADRVARGEISGDDAVTEVLARQGIATPVR